MDRCDADAARDATASLACRASALLARYAHPHAILLVVSGPSGVGKDSVVKRLRQSEHAFHFVVTMTDRPPRPGEVDGEDYCFVTTTAFEEMIDRGEFIEYAQVYDQYKGVPKVGAQRALESGQDVLMRLDVQGTATIRDRVPGAVTVFVAPPSLDVLAERLRRRPGDTPEQTEQRLRTALYEMERIDEFDYVIINREGELEETVAQVLAIVRAEKCRTGREPVRL